MDIKNDKITNKPLHDKDVGTFSKWLAKEYIYNGSVRTEKNIKWLG